MIRPGVVEVCDGVDNNCDSVIDPPAAKGPPISIQTRIQMGMEMRSHRVGNMHAHLLKAIQKLVETVTTRMRT